MPTKANGKPQYFLLHQLMLIGRLSHADVARKAKVSRQAVDAWCQGISKPSKDAAKRLERFFGKSIAQLFAPASLDGNDVVVLYKPKTHVECPKCQTQVRVL